MDAIIEEHMHKSLANSYRQDEPQGRIIDRIALISSRFFMVLLLSASADILYVFV